MPTSRKKIAANQTNGRMSEGPIDTSRTRFSATKHGLLARGITPLDDAKAYRTILSELRRERNPATVLEKELVEIAAFTITKYRTARRFSAEYVTAALNPPKHEKDLIGDLDLQFRGAVLDLGIPAALAPGHVQVLMNPFQSFEDSLLNRLLRIFRELEDVPRLRQGSRLPAPMAAPVRLHLPGRAKDLAIDGKRLPRKVTAVVVLAAAATVDSAPAKTDRQTVLTAERETVAEPATVDTVGSASETGKPPAAEWRPKTPSGPIWQRR
jgi:hypothetical protein